MDLGTLTVSLACDSRGLVAAQSAMSQFSKTATASLNTVAQRFRTVGYLTTAVLTYPIIQAGKSLLATSKDFEFSMQKIVGLAGVAQSSVNDWSQAVLDMGPRVAKGPKELADALYYIASSGIKGAQALEVLEISAKAATAGLGETKVVADVLTSALNAYAGTGLTATKAADILIAAVREGKGEADAFASAMGQLIPIAANVGVSFDQVAGAMAAITLTGSSAANAAVYLKGVLNVLLTANEQGKKALEKIGLTYQDLRKILSSGPTGLINLMQKFRDIQMQLGDEAVKDVIPNIRGLTAFMSIAGKNFAYNTKLMERVTNSAGSLGVAFAAVSETIKVRLDIALAKVQRSLIMLGKTVAPAITSLLEFLVKKLEDLTKWWNSLTEAQQRHKLVAIAVIAAIGPLSLITSTLIYTISGLVTVVNLLGNAFVFLASRVVITGQLTSISVAVKALTASMTAALPIIAAWGMAIMGIGIAVVAAWPLIQKLLDGIKGFKARQAEMQAALDWTTPSMELDTEIGKRMAMLKKLNQQELEDTQIKVAQRIALERERLINIETTGKKEIESEQFVLDKRKEIAESEKRWAHLQKTESWSKSDMAKFGQNISLEMQKANMAIDSYVKSRQAEVAYDKIAAEDTISFYTKQSKEIGKQLKLITPDPNALNRFEQLKQISIEAAEALERLQKSWYEITQTRMEKQYGPGAVQPIVTEKDRAKFLQSVMKYQQGLKIQMPALKFPAPEFGKDLEIMVDQVEKLTNGLVTQRQVVRGLANVFEEFFSGAEEGWKNLGNVITREIRRIAAEILAKMVVWVILNAITKGQAGTLKQFLFGIKTPVNAASGGVVPPGYSRDTYPAMLSSGEAVIPLDKFNSSMTLKEDLRFVIEDDRLVGLIKKKERRNNLY